MNSKNNIKPKENYKAFALQIRNSIRVTMT